MISNQVLQNTLEGLKEISRTEFCVIDTDGKVLASTFSDFEIQPADIQAFVESQADSQLVKGFQYFKVCDDYQLEYVLVALSLIHISLGAAASLKSNDGTDVRSVPFFTWRRKNL